MNNRHTCAHCHGSNGAPYPLLVAVARRAGLKMLAGAVHLHHHCASIVQRSARAGAFALVLLALQACSNCWQVPGCKAPPPPAPRDTTRR